MEDKRITWNQGKSATLLVCKALTEGIVLSPTDTVPGLLSCATEQGRMLLDTIKGRSSKPYLLLVDSFVMADQLAYLQGAINGYCFVQKCWPGPVTLILRARETTPHWMKSQDNTIAMRMPDHQQLLTVIKKVGPVFSTSANKAGILVPRTVAEVDNSIKERCVLTIYDSLNTYYSIPPSTIIDLSKDNVELVRAGSYSIQELETLCEYKIQVKEPR